MMDSKQLKPMEVSFCEGNSQGIAHMVAGRHAEANASFTKAVRTLRKMAEEIVPVRNAVLLHRIPILLSIEDKAKVSPDGSFELFDTAFLVSFSEGEGSFDHGVAIGTVLYNMALNAHMVGLRYEKASHIARAAFLYKMAGKMLRQVRVAAASVSEALLLLAHSNNQGHSEACMFDSVGSNHCRHLLVAIFEATVDVLCEEDRIFFQISCLVGDSISPGRVSPAA